MKRGAHGCPIEKNKKIQINRYTEKTLADMLPDTCITFVTAKRRNSDFFCLT